MGPKEDTILNLERYTGRTMHAYEVLEYPAVLAQLATHCETGLGLGLARALQPDFRAERVWQALEETGQAERALGAVSVPSLAPIRDLRDAVRRASRGGTLGVAEVYQAGEALQAMRSIRNALRAPEAAWPHLVGLSECLVEDRRTEEAIFDALDGDGEFKDSASPKLASLRSQKRQTATRLTQRIQSYTTGKTRDLLSDPIYTVRDGRFVIPLKAESRGKIRGIVHDTSASGNTVYLEPEDVLQIGNELRQIEAAEREEQQRILLALSARVGSIGDAFASRHRDLGRSAPTPGTRTGRAPGPPGGGGGQRADHGSQYGRQNGSDQGDRPLCPHGAIGPDGARGSGRTRTIFPSLGRYWRRAEPPTIALHL
jgi:dsDNA-specific endonuclease/ATPase MutS2